MIMENELEKTSKLKFLLESIVKIVANGQHPVLGIGALRYSRRQIIYALARVRDVYYRKQFLYSVSIERDRLKAQIPSFESDFEIAQTVP